VSRVGAALAVLTTALLRPGAIPAEELTLATAVGEARLRNPTAGIERSRVVETEADYRAARAGLLPRLSASGYWNRLDTDRLSPSGTVAPSPLFAREGFVGILARQLLYDGRTRALRRAAGEAVAAQRAGLASAEADVVYQVTGSYYRVLEARALVRAADDAVARAREFETLTSVLFDAGKVTRLDILKAQSGRLDAEAAGIRARELETAANALLAAAIGREAPDFRVSGELPRVEPVPPERTTLATALVANPDLELRRRQSAQAELTLAAARGARHPTISAQGGYAYRDRDVGGGTGEWTAGVFLELPVFDGGAIGAGVAKAAAALVQRREAERAARIEIESDLRQALSAWRTALADADSAAQRIATNRESASAAEALYGAGKATALDVLTAQADLVRAESDRAQALAEYAVARAATERLAGGPPPEGTGEQP
jgi:outer membrane protein TolC